MSLTEKILLLTPIAIVASPFILALCLAAPVIRALARRADKRADVCETPDNCMVMRSHNAARRYCATCQRWFAT